MICALCRIDISSRERYAIHVQRRMNSRWLASAYGYCLECGDKDVTKHRFKLHKEDEKKEFYKLTKGDK